MSCQGGGAEVVVPPRGVVVTIVGCAVGGDEDRVQEGHGCQSVRRGDLHSRGVQHVANLDDAVDMHRT